MTDDGPSNPIRRWLAIVSILAVASAALPAAAADAGPEREEGCRRRPWIEEPGCTASHATQNLDTSLPISGADEDADGCEYGADGDAGEAHEEILHRFDIDDGIHVLICEVGDLLSTNGECERRDMDEEIRCEVNDIL